MDNMPPGLAERSQTGGGTSNLSSFRRLSNRPVSTNSNLDGSSPISHFQTVVVIVHKDENGYGMKVSGDNPVYVQSVKEGGAAEKAGLQCGDMIIKVNGENVTQSTHLQVVSLIRASTHVELTVHQNARSQTPRASIAGMTSPSSHSRLFHSHGSTGGRGGERITGPQPVDVEKLRQFETQRVHTYRLMLEKEQLFVDTLRSKLAKCTDPQSGSKIQQDLNGAIRRVSTLQEELKNSIGQIDHSYNFSQLISPMNSFPIHTILEGVDEIPPPLPKRNRSFHSLNSHRSPIGAGPPLPTRSNNYHVPSTNDAALPSNTSMGGMGDTGSFQMPPHTIPLGHHRTKSNPDPLGSQAHSQNLSPAEASKKLIASESLQDIYKRSKSHPGSCDVDSPHDSPSGTPPPPYRGLIDDGNSTEEDVQLRLHDDQTPEVSPLRSVSVSHSSTPVLQNIMSMEDDDTPDQEQVHSENRGPFKSITTLRKNPAHLAVFMNYLMCNSDPSSLLFYLVTELYKEGSGKEMRKWAYEIHSSFLVPGAPLRLSNVDENFAREIDDVLLKESDKEEILKRIFWKTRIKAREEINEQLADFQQKLTAGLGTLFGPSEAALEESLNDKNKEMKIIESILLQKMESYMEDMEKDTVDMRKFTTAAALGTILSKVFGLRGPHASSILDRCPTFISKDKSLKSKLLIGKSRKLTVRGHQFVAHQYYTVTYCNHCQLIIWGIGPQGYQCTNCNLNVHRYNCVRVVEENCPGPITKKDRGDNRISKLMEKIRPEREARRKPTSLHVNQSDRGRRHAEDKDESTGISDADMTGDRSMTGLRAVEKRSETFRDSEEKPHVEDDIGGDDRRNDVTHGAGKAKTSATSINRSESYRERIPQKKVREKRKTSDPNLSKTSDVDLDTQGLSYNTNSGSSSNSSLSARSLDSPSGPLDMVTATQQRVQEAVTLTLTPNNVLVTLGDSDTETEADPPDWTKGVDENVLKSLSSREKKRQEVINELFHTEKSHVTRLKVLDQIFLKPMQECQILPPDQLHLLFQNLEEMLDIHSRFNSAMKAKKKESPLVGDIGDILAMFDGAEGDNFQRAAAVFCAKQQIALEQLKERRKKDTKLNNFLTEAEGNAMCRRLQLKDMLPTVMQRLTKYPLLFENLAKYSQSYPEEEKLLLKAVERSKAILNYVNQAVKAAEDHQRLEEIQKRLDKSAFEKVDHPMTFEFKNLDLRTHKLIYEGSLSWRIGNRQKPIDIYVLLLHDIIILLQKQDEKFVLKFYNMNTSSLLSPIVKVSSVLVRHNAVDKTALYLVNTSQNNAQIYDLVASSPSERIKWFRHISEAADAYKNKDHLGKHRRLELSASSPQSPPDSETTDESSEKNKESDECTNENEAGKGSNESEVAATTSQDGTSVSGHPNQISQNSVTATNTSPSGQGESGEQGKKTVESSLSHRTIIEPLRLSTVENSLIQPSEVVVSQKSVLTAEPVLTPLEQLRLKDEAIRKALAEKQQLVAEILHVPKGEFETIADIAAEPSIDKEATELILAAVNQANQLAAALNDSLKVTEEEAVAVTSEVYTGCSPRGNRRKSRLPKVPTHKLQGISVCLNSQLTQLLKIIKERDEERERLRRELQRSREQIHFLHEIHKKSPKSEVHYRVPDVAEESGDGGPEGGGAESVAGESSSINTNQNADNKENKSDAVNEVFVDALSGDAETMDNATEIAELEEDEAVEDGESELRSGKGEVVNSSTNDIL